MSRKALALAPVLAALTLPSQASAGGSQFQEVPGALDPQQCGGGNCWTNHMRMTDIDGDGDLDAIMVNYADFFGGNNSPQALQFYENDGAGGMTSVSATAVGNLETNAHQICIGDVDGDGAGDIYVPDGTGTMDRLMMNDGDGVYTDEGGARLPAQTPNSGACRFGDLDGDGDLDLVVATGYSGGNTGLLLYANDGTGVFTDVAGAFSGAISGNDIDDIEIFDADRDFDLDVFANAHGGGAGGLFLNDGSGALAGAPFPPPGPGSNFHYNAAPCDVDGDGDLDVWIDNTGGGYNEQLLLNDGGGVFSDVSAAQVSGNNGEDDNGVVCADIDNDGDYDAVVLSLQSPERFLENDGAGTFSFVGGVFPGGVDSTLWGEFGDLNGDGRLDLITAAGEFGNQDNRLYLGVEAQPVDDRAPQIIAVQSDAWDEGSDPVVRFAVSDRAMSDEGPRLASATITIEAPNDATIEATFVGGDVFYAALPTVPEGGYTYQACAEDRTGNVGCSDSVSITRGGPGGSDTGGDESSGGAADDTGDDAVGTDGGPDGGPGGSDGTVPTGGSGSDGTGDGGANDGDDDGCSCRSTGSAGWALFLLGAPLLRRRRRA